MPVAPYSDSFLDSLQPEMHLLLLCLRLAVSSPNRTATHPIQQAIQRMARQSLDWDLLIAIAIAHGVLPLIHKSLRLASITTQNSSFNCINRYCKLNAIRNLTLTQELLRLLNLFSREGISAIAFKGPALASFAYGDISMRQFSDLDILIHERDFPKAKSLLLSEGYFREKGISSTNDIQDAAYANRWGEFPLQHENNLFNIDLHCRLITGEIPLSTADLSIFWQGVIAIPLLNTQTKSFSPEDLLLYLCIHGAKDFWKKLIWLCDVAAIVTHKSEHHPDIDWTLLIEKARCLDCEQILYLGLSLAKDVLDLSLPEVITQQIQTTFTKQALSYRIQTRLLSFTLPQSAQHFYLSRFHFYAQMQDSRRDQLRYYWQYSPTFAKRWLARRTGVKA